MFAKNLLLTLTLLWMVLTLTTACRFMGPFVCLPDQYSCRRVGGKCSVQGGNCVCVPHSTFYSFGPPGLGSYYRGGPQGKMQNVEPEHIRKTHPLGEHNIEQQTKLLTSMVRLYKIMN